MVYVVGRGFIGRVNPTTIRAEARWSRPTVIEEGMRQAWPPKLNILDRSKSGPDR